MCTITDCTKCRHLLKLQRKHEFAKINVNRCLRCLCKNKIIFLRDSARNFKWPDLQHYPLNFHIFDILSQTLIFLCPLSFQFNVVDLIDISISWFLLDQIIYILKFYRVTSSCCKDIGLRIFESVTQTQFLWIFIVKM